MPDLPTESGPVAAEQQRSVPSIVDESSLRHPKNWIGIIQLLATFGTLGWAIYLFFGFEKKDRELAIKLAELNVDRSEHELQQLNSPQLAPTHAVKVSDFGPSAAGSDEHDYYVEYQYFLKNTSQRKNEVTYVIVHVYYAEPVVARPGEILHIDGFAEDADVRWRPVHSVGYYYAPKWNDVRKFPLPGGGSRVFNRGNGGTAELDAGEDSQGGFDLYLKAPPTALIGFDTQIILNEGKTADDKWRIKLWQPFKTGDASTNLENTNGDN